MFTQGGEAAKDLERCKARYSSSIWHAHESMGLHVELGRKWKIGRDLSPRRSTSLHLHRSITHYLSDGFILTQWESTSARGQSRFAMKSQ